MDYLVEKHGTAVTLWIAKPETVEEAVVPCDGSIMLRDAATGVICGKRIDNIGDRRWTEDALGETFAVAFGRGQNGPIWALRDAGILRDR
jgi:hypothetical protein